MSNRSPNFAQFMNAEAKRYPLGRLISPDSRDADYPMHLALSILPPRATSGETRFWNTGPVLDQKNTNHCVGFSMRSFLDAAPYRTRGGATGDEIYYTATELDEIPGSRTEDGTSIRAGVKALQQYGHIQQYVWAYDAETIAQFILTQGTVVVGTNWYNNMFNPVAADGYLIHPTGSIVGGHAYHIIGADRNQRIFKIKNSWSAQWGQKGFAYLGFNDLNRLLSENGEAVAALEQPVIIGGVR